MLPILFGLKFIFKQLLFFSDKDESKSNPYRIYSPLFLSCPALLVICSRCTCGLIATPLKNTKAAILILNNIEESICILKDFT